MAKENSLTFAVWSKPGFSILRWGQDLSSLSTLSPSRHLGKIKCVSKDEGPMTARKAPHIAIGTPSVFVLMCGGQKLQVHAENFRKILKWLFWNRNLSHYNEHFHFSWKKSSNLATLEVRVHMGGFGSRSCPLQMEHMLQLPTPLSYTWPSLHLYVTFLAPIVTWICEPWSRCFWS